MKTATKILICLMIFAIFGCSCNANPAQGTSSDYIESGASSTAAANSADADTQANASASTLSEPTSSSQVSTAPSKPSVSSTETSSKFTPSGNTSSAQSESTEPTIKYVAFTFDDGPHYVHTKNIVNKFKEYGGACTFFVIGNRIGDVNGAAIKYAVDNGCEIGIHAYTHEYNYSKCSDESYKQELSKTADAIHKYLPDYNIKLMRPVGGNITKSRIESSQYSVINWNVDSADWKYKSSNKSTAISKIRNNIMKDINDGSIVLMHEIYNNSYDALCTVLDELYKQGYRFVTVSELIGEDNLQPGKKYLHR